MIRVNDDYVIDVDSMNYTAKIDKHKITTDKNGRTYSVYDIIGYYGDLEGALQGVKKQMICDALSSDEKTLEEAIKTIQQINREFVEMFKKAIKE